MGGRGQGCLWCHHNRGSENFGDVREGFEALSEHVVLLIGVK